VFLGEKGKDGSEKGGEPPPPPSSPLGRPDTQVRILVAGERCNVTGEYFERGSSSE